MVVYLCQSVHGGGAANRAESVGDIWKKSPLLLCITIWILFIEFEEGNQPGDFAVENVSDRMRVLARLEGASRCSPPRTTYRKADVEVAESLKDRRSAAILRGTEKKATRSGDKVGASRRRARSGPRCS